jgi:O-antigen/teichoic acid export membrane protein
MTEPIKFIKSLFQKFFLDSFYILLPTVVSIFLAVITLPIVLKSLPLEDYGLYQFVISIQVLMTVFSVGQVTTSAKRGIARGLEGTFLYAFYFRMKIFIAIGLIGLSASLLLYSLNYAGLNLFLLMIVMSLYTLFGYLPQVSYPEYLVAKKQFKKFSFLQCLTYLVPQIASVLAAYFTHNIVLYAVAQFGLVAIISIASFVYILKKDRVVESYKNGAIDHECVGYGLKMIPADIANGTAGQASSFIVGPFFGFGSLAVFSVASRLDGIFKGFVGSLYNLLYAEFAKRDVAWLSDFINKKLLFGFFLSLLAAVPFLAASYSYIYFFMPANYQFSMNYLLILSFGFPAFVLQTILHTLLDTNFKYKELTVIAVLPNLIKIGFIVLFGLMFGVLGVCIAIALAGWINLLFYYLFVFKKGLIVSTARQVLNKIK